MCGIWGFVTDKTDYEVKYKLARALALATEVRGRHATGYAGSDGVHERYAKHGESATLFVERPEFKAILDDKPNMIIGHDRWATHGDPSDNANNHPFKSRVLQFMHNGVINNYESLKAEYRCYSECDSEVILRVLERADRRIKGIQNVYKEVRGSFACGLMDTRKLRLWLWRNYGNPIYLAYNESLNILAFASTRDIFDSACKEAGITEGWNKGQYWNDEYILCVKYVPPTDIDGRGKILRETVEVESKQIDPATVSQWSDRELSQASKWYRKVERTKQHQSCKRYKDRHQGQGECTKLLAKYYDAKNGCWVY